MNKKQSLTVGEKGKSVLLVRHNGTSATYNGKKIPKNGLKLSKKIKEENQKKEINQQIKSLRENHKRTNGYLGYFPEDYPVDFPDSEGTVKDYHKLPKVNEMDEVNRQIKMGWQRGFELGFVVGIAIPLVTLVLAIVLFNSAIINSIN